MIEIIAAATSSRGAVEHAVEEVLADPAYQAGLSGSSGGLNSLVEWMRNAIPRLIAQILRYLDELHAESPVIFWIAFLALCAVLVALLAHIGWTLSLAFRRPTPRTGEESSLDGRERARRSREILEEARSLARNGSVREALRSLLLAVLALLEERSILRIASGWTHREIAARIRAPVELRGELSNVLRTVEAAWYGNAVATQEDFRRSESTILRLVEALAAGATTNGRGGASA